MHDVGLKFVAEVGCVPAFQFQWENDSAAFGGGTIGASFLVYSAHGFNAFEFMIQLDTFQTSRRPDADVVDFVAP